MFQVLAFCVDAVQSQYTALLTGRGSDPSRQEHELSPEEQDEREERISASVLRALVHTVSLATGSATKQSARGALTAAVLDICRTADSSLRKSKHLLVRQQLVALWGAFGQHMSAEFADNRALWLDVLRGVRDPAPSIRDAAFEAAVRIASNNNAVWECTSISAKCKTNQSSGNASSLPFELADDLKGVYTSLLKVLATGCVDGSNVPYACVLPLIASMPTGLLLADLTRSSKQNKAADAAGGGAGVDSSLVSQLLTALTSAIMAGASRAAVGAFWDTISFVVAAGTRPDNSGTVPQALAENAASTVRSHLEVVTVNPASPLSPHASSQFLLGTAARLHGVAAKREGEARTAVLEWASSLLTTLGAATEHALGLSNCVVTSHVSESQLREMKLSPPAPHTDDGDTAEVGAAEGVRRPLGDGYTSLMLRQHRLAETPAHAPSKGDTDAGAAPGSYVPAYGARSWNRAAAVWQEVISAPWWTRTSTVSGAGAEDLGPGDVTGVGGVEVAGGSSMPTPDRDALHDAVRRQFDRLVVLPAIYCLPALNDLACAIAQRMRRLTEEEHVAREDAAADSTAAKLQSIVDCLLQLRAPRKADLHLAVAVGGVASDAVTVVSTWLAAAATLRQLPHSSTQSHHALLQELSQGCISALGITASPQAQTLYGVVLKLWLWAVPETLCEQAASSIQQSLQTHSTVTNLSVQARTSLVARVAAIFTERPCLQQHYPALFSMMLSMAQETPPPCDGAASSVVLNAVAPAVAAEWLDTPMRSAALQYILRSTGMDHLNTSATQGHDSEHQRSALVALGKLLAPSEETARAGMATFVQTLAEGPKAQLLSVLMGAFRTAFGAAVHTTAAAAAAVEDAAISTAAESSQVVVAARELWTGRSDDLEAEIAAMAGVFDSVSGDVTRLPADVKQTVLSTLAQLSAMLQHTTQAQPDQSAQSSSSISMHALRSTHDAVSRLVRLWAGLVARGTPEHVGSALKSQIMALPEEWSRVLGMQALLRVQASTSAAWAVGLEPQERRDLLAASYKLAGSGALDDILLDLGAQHAMHMTLFPEHSPMLMAAMQLAQTAGGGQTLVPSTGQAYLHGILVDLRTALMVCAEGVGSSVEGYGGDLAAFTLMQAPTSASAAAGPRTVFHDTAVLFPAAVSGPALGQVQMEVATCQSLVAEPVHAEALRPAIVESLLAAVSTFIDGDDDAISQIQSSDLFHGVVSLFSWLQPDSASTCLHDSHWRRTFVQRLAEALQARFQVPQPAAVSPSTDSSSAPLVEDPPEPRGVTSAEMVPLSVLLHAASVCLFSAHTVWPASLITALSNGLLAAIQHPSWRTSEPASAGDTDVAEPTVWQREVLRLSTTLLPHITRSVWEARCKAAPWLEDEEEQGTGSELPGVTFPEEWAIADRMTTALWRDSAALRRLADVGMTLSEDGLYSLLGQTALHGLAPLLAGQATLHTDAADGALDCVRVCMKQLLTVPVLAVQDRVERGGEGMTDDHAAAIGQSLAVREWRITDQVNCTRLASTVSRVLAVQPELAFSMVQSALQPDRAPASAGGLFELFWQLSPLLWCPVEQPTTSFLHIARSLLHHWARLVSAAAQPTDEDETAAAPDLSTVDIDALAARRGLKMLPASFCRLLESTAILATLGALEPSADEPDELSSSLCVAHPLRGASEPPRSDQESVLTRLQETPVDAIVRCRAAASLLALALDMLRRLTGKANADVVAYLGHAVHPSSDIPVRKTPSARDWVAAGAGLYSCVQERPGVSILQCYLDWVGGLLRESGGEAVFAPSKGIDHTGVRHTTDALRHWFMADREWATETTILRHGALEQSPYTAPVDLWNCMLGNSDVPVSGRGGERDDEEEEGDQLGLKASVPVVLMRQEYVDVVLYGCCMVLPVRIAQWWRDLSRGTNKQVERYIQDVVCPRFLATEIRKLNSAFAAGGSAGASGTFTARGSIATREIEASYVLDECRLTMVISIPAAFPLRRVTVSSKQIAGVSESKWKRWQMEIAHLIATRDIGLVDVVHQWRANLDKEFDGVEPCPICYGVIHPTEYTVPKLHCSCCVGAFHSACIAKWFRTSQTTNCPLCRQSFN